MAVLLTYEKRLEQIHVRSEALSAEKPVLEGNPSDARRGDHSVRDDFSVRYSTR
jgi:hypothetical protein